MLTLLILLIHASATCGFLALGLGLFVIQPPKQVKPEADEATEPLDNIWGCGKNTLRISYPLRQTLQREV